METRIDWSNNKKEGKLERQWLEKTALFAIFDSGKGGPFYAFRSTRSKSQAFLHEGIFLRRFYVKMYQK